MGKVATYDEDIVLWAERQAEVLRSLSGRPGVPDELDIENVAGKIETVGRTEIRAAESPVRLIFVHLLKATSVPYAPARTHWKAEVANWHYDLLGALTPSMRQRIDIDRVWRRAQREAALSLEAEGTALADDLPQGAPVSLEELAAEE
ncbi:MAG TPA: DUF29 domain-containing protein, partial [Hyphomicrobiales bacterium]|nr:DUF29 domain-containing protein [Hyphomicrobiales bacterium]